MNKNLVHSLFFINFYGRPELRSPLIAVQLKLIENRECKGLTGVTRYAFRGASSEAQRLTPRHSFLFLSFLLDRPHPKYAS